MGKSTKMQLIKSGVPPVAISGRRQIETGKRDRLKNVATKVKTYRR
jgi:hypothetical protein